MNRRFASVARYISVSIVILLFIAVFSACSKSGGLGITTPLTDTLGGEASGDEVGTGSDDSSSGSDTTLGPAASVPLPDHTGFLVANDGVIQGAGEAGYGLHASVTDTGANNYLESPEYFMAHLQSTILKTADRFVTLITPTAYAQDSTCYTDGTNITINADGSIDPQLIEGLETYSATSQVTFTYFNLETCEEGDSVTDAPLKNLVYVHGSSSTINGVTVNGSNIAQVTSDGMIANMEYNSSTSSFSPVNNKFDQNYIYTEYGSPVTGMYYSPFYDSYVFNDGSLIVAKVMPGNIDLPLEEFPFGGHPGVNCDPAGYGLCSSESTPYQSGCMQKRIKVVGDRAYFSTVCDEKVESGILHELFNDGSFNKINFNEKADTGLYYISTQAFDVNMSGDFPQLIAAALVEDTGVEKLELFGVYDKPAPYKYNIELAGLSDIKDLIIFYNQPDDDSANGKVIILSSYGVHFVEYDLLDYSGIGGDIQEASIGTSIEISNPISVVVNSGNTFAFVLSNGSDASGDYITVIDLTNQAKDVTKYASLYTTETGVIYLSDIFSGKTIADFNPTAIQVVKDDDNNHHLYVSSGSLDSGVVVDL